MPSLPSTITTPFSGSAPCAAAESASTCMRRTHSLASSLSTSATYGAAVQVEEAMPLPKPFLPSPPVLPLEGAEDATLASAAIMRSNASSAVDLPATLEEDPSHCTGTRRTSVERKRSPSNRAAIKDSRRNF
eukprot:scaffold125944_cov27-Tisochrysis_lutea.AAC.1